MSSHRILYLVDNFGREEKKSNGVFCDHPIQMNYEGRHEGKVALLVGCTSVHRFTKKVNGKPYEP